MRVIRTSFLLVGIVLITTSAYSQVGGAAVPFLLIAPDARAGAMGEVGTAIADDINAVFWNPAGLGFQTQQRQVGLNFSKWLPQFNADLYYSYGSYGQFIEDLDGTIAGTFIFMNLGEFQRTAENGQALGTFRSNEFSVGVSYGTLIGTDVAAGVQIKYIQSNLAPAGAQQVSAGVGISGAFDLGFLYRPTDLDILGAQLGNVLSLGANLQNVGPKMTYLNESDPLPTTLRMGVGLKLVEDEFNDLLVSVDLAKLLVRRDLLGSDPVPQSFVSAWGVGGIESGVGMEYVYDQAVSLRGGYFSEPAAAGGRQFYTLGAGVKYDLFNLYFSYILTVEDNHPLANTLRFSLVVDWGTEQ